MKRRYCILLLMHGFIPKGLSCTNLYEWQILLVESDSAGLISDSAVWFAHSLRVERRVSGEWQWPVSSSLFLSRSTVAISSWVVWFGDRWECIKAEIAAAERHSWDRAHSAQTHVDNGSFSFQLPMCLHKLGGIEQGWRSQQMLN